MTTEETQPNPSVRSLDTSIVTCVVPAYNEHDNLSLLLPTLQAMLTAACPNWEIIVVDDGSKDKTADLMLVCLALAGLTAFTTWPLRVLSLLTVTTSIGICADDFGLETGINEGILALVAQGRLSAVSCLAQGQYFSRDSAALASMDVDIGLHLNFTEALTGSDLSLPVPRLILQAYSHALSTARIRAQIDQQLDRFDALVGRSPDFVDGHEHVHQLPVIRDALLTALKHRYPKQAIWLRSLTRFI
eukprot:gene8005-8079_t